MALCGLWWWWCGVGVWGLLRHVKERRAELGSECAWIKQGVNSKQVVERPHVCVCPHISHNPNCACLLYPKCHAHTCEPGMSCGWHRAPVVFTSKKLGGRRPFLFSSSPTDYFERKRRSNTKLCSSTFRALLGSFVFFWRIVISTFAF